MDILGYLRKCSICDSMICNVLNTFFVPLFSEVLF
jgi:hypothetical protein